MDTAAEALGCAFSQVPDKQQAWNDLHRLTFDQESHVRSNAAEALGSVFPEVPDKQQTWNDLHRLTNDEDSSVRSNAASALGSAFSYVPDKQQAWSDLHRLTNDEDKYVRSNAASALGSAFSYVPDKQQAWNDLIKLTNDENRDVRPKAASALGSAFSYVPDKQQAWNDLIKLTNDEDSSVRTSSNHSLGRASIFIASQAESDEDYKKELEKAIKFFEIAANEASYNNPAQFCLPFYRSFYTIIFKKQEAREEVDKYLEKAKAAIKGSESKKQLVESVENLAEALKEVQNLGNLDLSGMKDELNFYRKYCEHAAELMKFTDEKAPFATKALKRGLPILDRNLKELLEEIQKRTEVIREQTKGTQFEELGDELNQNSQFLSQIRDPVGLEKQVNSLQNIVRVICSKFPEGQKGEACELLKMMYAEPLFEDKIPLMVNLLNKLSYQLDMTAQLNQFGKKLDELYCIRDDIFKIKLSSHNIISKLDAMKKELEKLNEIKSLNTLSIEKLNSIQVDMPNNLDSDIQDRLDDLAGLIEDLPKNNDIKEILEKLNKLRQSNLDILLQRSSGITSLISFFVMFAQMYQNYIC
jgi:HEAT repeat protein